MIRDANAADAKTIAEIYNHYIENTIVTFEETPVTAEEMWSRMGLDRGNFPWLVFEEEGQVLGSAYASKWKGRCAYRYSAECSVYLDHQATGKGVGTALYSKLLEELKGHSIHTVIGGIALPNAASVALHEKLGFTQVALFKEVGRKFNRWIDVGYWQRKLPLFDTNADEDLRA